MSDDLYEQDSTNPPVIVDNQAPVPHITDLPVSQPNVDLTHLPVADPEPKFPRLTGTPDQQWTQAREVTAGFPELIAPQIIDKIHTVDFKLSDEETYRHVVQDETHGVIKIGDPEDAQAFIYPLLNMASLQHSGTIERPDKNTQKAFANRQWRDKNISGGTASKFVPHSPDSNEAQTRAQIAKEVIGAADKLWQGTTLTSETGDNIIPNQIVDNLILGIQNSTPFQARLNDPRNTEVYVTGIHQKQKEGGQVYQLISTTTHEPNGKVVKKAGWIPSDEADRLKQSFPTKARIIK